MPACAAMRRALVGAGANLGDRRATLEAAIAHLRAHAEIFSVVRSSFYETDPVGYLDQPSFLNLTLAVETTLTPEMLMGELLAAEHGFGRVRTVRWGPRTIDLDLLAFEGETRTGPVLSLPHPRMFERTFVTVPLRELLSQPALQTPCWDSLRSRLAPLENDPAVRRLPESTSSETTTKAPAAVSLDPAAVEPFLIGLKQRGVRLGLDRMQRWVATLGHPEAALPCIHLAGTNGKGSVAAMLASTFRAAGWRTGLYTSPHLVKLGERLQVDGVALAPGKLAAAVCELAPLAAQLVTPADRDGHPSYFEFMTGLAFQHFARQRCDVAIIETGLGGRLDATNVVTPEVSVITSIGLDHCEFLGDSLEQIAAEKAGIIKPGRPVVIGRLPAAAAEVIRTVAAERGSRMWSVAEEFGDDLSRCPRTSLEGDYQRWNAATAVLVTRLLPPSWRLGLAVVELGLQEVVWPGRWQRVHLGGQTLILDASHNAEGAQALDANLARLHAEAGRAPVVILGVLGAVRAKPLLETVCRYARELHLVVPRQARACTHEQLEALVPAGFGGVVRRATIEDLFPEPHVCIAGSAEDPVVVTGSIYLLGEVLVRLDPSCGPLESQLQDF